MPQGATVTWKNKSSFLQTLTSLRSFTRGSSVSQTTANQASAPTQNGANQQNGSGNQVPSPNQEDSADTSGSSTQQGAANLTSSSKAEWKKVVLYPGQMWSHTFDQPGTYLFAAFGKMARPDNPLGVLEVSPSR